MPFSIIETCINQPLNQLQVIDICWVDINKNSLYHQLCIVRQDEAIIGKVPLRVLIKENHSIILNILASSETLFEISKNSIPFNMLCPIKHLTYGEKVVWLPGSLHGEEGSSQGPQYHHLTFAMATDKKMPLSKVSSVTKSCEVQKDQHNTCVILHNVIGTVFVMKANFFTITLTDCHIATASNF